MLSIVVVFFNMRREAPRTLYTLSRAYQREIEDLEYEVIAVDNGSSEPLDPALVANFGPEFRYLRLETDSKSPCAAINLAAAQADGSYVSVAIDGARMVSPGALRHTALAAGLAERPVVTTLAWHLGDKLQNQAVVEGYDQDEEDELLNGIDWRADGYELFDIACLAASSVHGWSRPLPESNLLTVTREMFDALDGFDEHFQTDGGGLANHDYLKRALQLDRSEHILLLGEGTFHQFHGGVATNVPMSQHPGPTYKKEYEELRGEPFTPADKPPLLLGTIAGAFASTAAELAAKVQRHRDA